MNQRYKNHSHHISFKNALEGIIYSFTTQPNFIVIFIATLVVLLASYLLQVSYLEFLIIIWTVFIVFVAEMINTAIESMTDLITTEWRKEAKIAKDVSSGMTLLTVIGSIIIGLVIFLPKMFKF